MNFCKGALVLSATLCIAITYPSVCGADTPKADKSKETQPAQEKGSGALSLAALKNQGIEFHGTYMAEVLGNVSGGFARRTATAALLKLEMSVDLEKHLGLKGTKLYASGLYPHGENLSNKAVGDLNGLSNIAAYNSPRLFELWVEKEFGAVSVRLGQLAADSEFFTCNAGGVFFNSCFGALPSLSANMSVPIYPAGTPGVRVRYTFSPELSLAAGVYYGDPGDPAYNNNSGTRWKLDSDDGAFAITELTWTPEPESKLPGIYKLGAFYHTSQAGDYDGSGVADVPSNGGLYGIIEKKVYAAGEEGSGGLTLFTRVSGAQEDRSVVAFYAEGGANYQGLIPGRADDISGFATSFTHTGGAHGVRQTETVFEWTYKAVINETLAVQPDVHYILNPGATSENGDALVLGLRAILTF